MSNIKLEPVVIKSKTIVDTAGSNSGNFLYEGTPQKDEENRLITKSNNEINKNFNIIGEPNGIVKRPQGDFQEKQNEDLIDFSNDKISNISNK